MHVGRRELLADGAPVLLCGRAFEIVEVLVRSGLIGSFIFLLAIAGMIGLARSAAAVEAAFTVTLALLVMLTESALEMQHTLFLFSFFPLLTASQSPYRTHFRPLFQSKRVS